jgi:hypothetical protein
MVGAGSDALLPFPGAIESEIHGHLTSALRRASLAGIAPKDRRSFGSSTFIRFELAPSNHSQIFQSSAYLIPQS